MNIKEYKDSLLNFDLKSFLERYTEKDIFRLSDLYPELYKLLAEQLKLYPRAKEKLPVFTSNYCYLTTKSYEQSTSESLAKYKAGLFSGEVLIDLSGGLGVDDWAFSRSFKNVISVDNDAELNELAKINFKKLNINNIERVDADSVEFIKKDIRADLIYIDADRRVKNKRSVTLEDASPSILQMLNRLFEISENILLKLSPLIDITYLIKILNGIEKIAVVSLDNEVKEVLVHLKRNYSGEPILEAVDISKRGIEKYSGNFGEAVNPGVTSEGKYFYEPAGSLIKSGLTNSYAHTYDLNTISKNGAYLLNDELKSNFFGRSFIVVDKIPFSKSGLLRYLKENNITKANISKRNFPLTAAELKKLSKQADGGEEYLFFTCDPAGKKLVYHCRKV
jgi:hypothetical protein